MQGSCLQQVTKRDLPERPFPSSKDVAKNGTATVSGSEIKVIPERPLGLNRCASWRHPSPVRERHGLGRLLAHLSPAIAEKLAAGDGRPAGCLPSRPGVGSAPAKRCCSGTPAERRRYSRSPKH